MHSMRITLLLGVLLAGFIGPGVCSAGPSEQGFDFCLKNIHDGSQFRLADHHGQTMLLVFGSIYCKPCVKLLPVLNRLNQQKASLGFLTAGINVDRSTDESLIKEFVEKHHIEFPVLIDNMNLARQHKIFMLPTIIYVDGNGREVKRHVGYQTYDELVQAMQSLQPQPSASAQPCRSGSEKVP